MPEITPYTSSVLVLLSTIVLKIVLSQFLSHEPLNFFRFYCDRLGDKVNKPVNSNSQQRVAGLIAIIVTLAPLLIILWLFEAYIEVPILWQSLLLYFALGSFGVTNKTKNIAQALTTNKTNEAKQILAPLVLRETDKMSSMGLCKASIEMQLLLSIQQYFIVSFYFLLAGPLAALSFRLLLEMHYRWNIKQSNFVNFGLRADQIVNILQWLPSRLFVFVMLLGTIGQNFILFWRLINKQFFYLNNNISLYCLALAIDKKLGGVAIYKSKKLRKTSFNDQANQPDVSDVIHAAKRINQVLVFSALALALSGVLAYAITLKN